MKSSLQDLPEALQSKRSSDVYLMDCMDGMRQWPDKYFDLAVVDPEYGIGIANRSGSIGQKKGQGKITKYTKKHWDKQVPSPEYFKELFRISKNQIIWGANYFTNNLPPAKGWIVWDKRQPQGVTFAMAELAYTSFDISTKLFSCSRSLIGNKISNNKYLASAHAKIHPTQKPIELYDWIYKSYFPIGGRVIDAHLGSGTNRISAFKTGNVDFTGYEIDEQYYEKHLKKWKQFISQTKLI